MTDWAIHVDHLSKLYRIGLKEERHETIAGAAWDFIRSPISNFSKLHGLSNISAKEQDSADVIWALRDVSFEVKEGDVVGIVGANGAGKSTLLKILAGITEPSSGQANIRGRVASLLEVGTGFHPELTGRENVYLNGTILGMMKAEIDRKFDEIVAFSGIEKFIDTPVKRYSSGMSVRLAFAVAAHLEPEILLIDEVLAVGDVEFQKRCLGKMGEVASEGRTVLFVSHNMGAVSSLCEWGMMVDEGRIAFSGPIAQVVGNYVANQRSRPDDTESVISDEEGGGVRLTRNAREQHFTCGEPIDLHFEIESPFLVEKATAGIVIYDMLGSPVAGMSSKHQKIRGEGRGRRWSFRCDLGQFPINGGRYHVSVWFGNDVKDLAWFSKAFTLNIIPSDPFGWGKNIPKQWGLFYWEPQWSIVPLEQD